MSGQSTGWVLRNGPRDRAMRAVLVTIADAANRDGEHAHPGMEAMVEGSLYSEGHVRRTIARLIEEGWIEQTEAPGPGKAAEYRLLDPETGLGIAESNGAHSARRLPGVPGPTARERRANGARPGARRSEPGTNSSIDGNANGLATRATDDPVKDHAHRLAMLAFEQTPKPVTRGGFPAVMARIEDELRAGTVEGHIRAAIIAGDVTWTADGLRTAIGRAKPRAATRKDGIDDTYDDLLARSRAGDGRN